MRRDEKSQEIMDVFLASLEDAPEILVVPGTIDNSPRTGISLSAAGKKPRQLAHMLAGTPRGELRPRSRAVMDMGTLAHEYLRSVIEASNHVKLRDAEREVTYELENGGLISGHIDGILEMSWGSVLLDIKVVDTLSYVLTDPRNNDENFWKRKNWSAGEFHFDPIKSWDGEPFKGSYLHQVACYNAALESEMDHIDDMVFVIQNRNTGHLAVGLFDPSNQEYERYLDEAEDSLSKALNNPNPLSHGTCHPAAVGAKPHIECQYCSYTDECFDMAVTTFRGKPQMKIKNIL